MSTAGIWTSLGLRKLRTTLGEIVRLHNCAVADKGSIDEHHRDLDKSGQSTCVMMSCHSCGEDWKVNEAFRGITVIKM